MSTNICYFLPWWPSFVKVSTKDKQLDNLRALIDAISITKAAIWSKLSDDEAMYFKSLLNTLETEYTRTEELPF